MHYTHNENYVISRPARTLLRIVRKDVCEYSSDGLLLVEHDGALFHFIAEVSPEARAAWRWARAACATAAWL
jgi:hypothetical protein